MKVLRDAICVALRDPNFMAEAAQYTGSPLRHRLARRLEEAGLEVEIVAAIATGNSPPYPEAEIVWREKSDGELTHQTIKWDLAPWAFALDHFQLRPARGTH
jgi:hypothetical protein